MTKLEKKIPKTLGECYQDDRVSSELWNWAQKLEEWKVKVAFALICFGIATIIIECAANEEVFFELVLSGIINCIVYAVISYFSLKAIALLISALAVIVQNTKVSANVALYTAAKEEPDTEVKEVVKKESVFKNIKND